MTGPSHTPGPWVDNVDGVVVVDKPGRWREIIADVHANPLEANNRSANTLLIAAAPDLLKALEGLLDALPSATTHPAIQAAHAAIAKAKGEQP